MEFSPLVKQLIDAFRVLPGVGPKSAQRMAFHLLERERSGGLHLAEILKESMQNVGRCQRCRILCERESCLVCENTNRDHKQLCIVQSPQDVVAIEQAGGYRGYYFVLSGHLSPIDGIGPEDIGITELNTRLHEKGLEEVVIATNATVEGEATAFYISEMIKKHQLKASRIAQGVPMGGELEYLDGGTLARALIERTVL